MAILHRFLRFLELIERVVGIVDFMATPIGIAITACLVSYELLLLAHCDRATAGILASAIALALHCGTNRPKF